MTDSTQGGMIRAHTLQRILDFAATRGHDPEPVCREFGVSLSALDAPDARVPYALVEQIGMRVVEIVRDPNLGLHIGQALEKRAGRFDAGMLLMLASPTFGACLDRLEQFQRFWGDGQRAHMRATPHGLCVRYTLHAGSSEYRRHADECAMAELVTGARMLTEQPLTPRCVRFQHLAPANIREHIALFRCPIEFAASHTEIEIDQRWLDAPMPHANETYRGIFQAQVERALARLPGVGTTGDVRAAAEAALASGQCSLVATARALGISTRTLQRRLHADGTSFEALVDALRRELAAKYLDEQLPIQQIAWLLGYADPSAFHRAWKRWTGTTPEQARSTRSRQH
ncbi:MAG: AraC family transcriptional regulator [Polyangiales bacterium]